MRPHYVSHAPFTKCVLAVCIYRKRDWNFRPPGHLYIDSGSNHSFESFESSDRFIVVVKDSLILYKSNYWP